VIFEKKLKILNYFFVYVEIKKSLVYNLIKC
jgi:hypothetical protein